MDVNNIYVTVVIPIFNAEKYIEECVNSLMKQTHKVKVEYLFINDGSTDKSMEILKSILAHYTSEVPIIRIIDNSVNKGVTAIRKQGIEEAKGKYIAWLDSDDWIDSTWLQDFIDGSENGKNDIVIQGVTREVYSNGTHSQEVRIFRPVETPKEAVKLFWKERHMPRAISADLEEKILKLALKLDQGANKINGMQHKFVAGDATNGFGKLTPEDFAYATVALKKVNYIGPKIAIIPSYQEYAIVTNDRIKASLSYNPKFEGIVREGAMSGMRFSFSIYGWDVYTSEFLPHLTEANLKDRDEAGTHAVTNAGVALLFANIAERRPFRMAWRQMPKFEGRWNMAKQREEYVTVARYGLDLGDKENLIVIACSDTDSTIA